MKLSIKYSTFLLQFYLQASVFQGVYLKTKVLSSLQRLNKIHLNTILPRSYLQNIIRMFASILNFIIIILVNKKASLLPKE